MARAFVTGGAGFIGSYVAEALVDAGHDVVVLDDLSGGSAHRVPDGAHFVEGSVADAPLVSRLFAQHRFQCVFHLAAFAAEAISHTVKRLNYETNLLGSINVVNGCLDQGSDHLAFASSVAVYGHGRVPMRESDDPVPADSYGLAKLTVERELAITMAKQRLPFTAFRMHNVYGEWQNMADPFRNAVAIFLNQILHGEPITVYGDGSQRRAFTYVRDIVGPFLAAAETPQAWGEAFNVGSATVNSVRELAEQVRDAMGVPDHPIVGRPDRQEVMVAYTDSAKARRVFGDRTDTSLTDGLRRTAEWARDHGPVPVHASFARELGGAEHVPEWAEAVWARAGSGVE